MREWKGLKIESEGEGISGALSYQVNLLGTLLEEVGRLREEVRALVYRET